jgi:hypothetical protein
VSPAARAALQTLLAWKLSLHGVPARGRVRVRVNPAGAAFSRFPAGASVRLPRIAGHRDGDSTDCPGDVLYGQLPGVREAVGALAPRPATLSIALVPPPPAAAPGSPAPRPGQTEQPPTGTPAEPSPAPAPGSGPGTGPAPVLQGRLAFVDGAPIAGAPVLVQARAVSRRGETVLEQAIGQALTDGAGNWSLQLPAAIGPGGAALRALYPGASGAGACVSSAIELAGAGR